MNKKSAQIQDGHDQNLEKPIHCNGQLHCMGFGPGFLPKTVQRRPDGSVCVHRLVALPVKTGFLDATV